MSSEFLYKDVTRHDNDIKLGEILVDENNKIYLCDFGWASVNNKLGCGIGIWNGKKIVSADDAKTLQRLKLI